MLLCIKIGLQLCLTLYRIVQDIDHRNILLSLQTQEPG
nr:MAG TPA: hypothetical protein [Caudoviricetes sp.]